MVGLQLLELLIQVFIKIRLVVDEPHRRFGGQVDFFAVTIF